MADGVPITSGAGLTVATDEDGSGFQNQWVKIKFGGDGSFTAVSTANGFPVQILSLPDLGLNSSVKITSLPDLGLGSSVKITSLPDLGAGSVVKITSLPDLGLNSSVKITSLPQLAVGTIISVSGLTSAVVSVNNLVSVLSTVTNAGTFPVQITSLPNFAVGQIISVSGLTSAIVSISNLSTTLQLVSGTTIAVTSLPDLGLNSSVKITSLPALGVGSSVIIAKPTNPWSYTATFTSAQTNAVLIALPGSTTALYLTDVVFSNCTTQGNMALIESRSNAAIREKITQLFFAPNGGATINFRTPVVLDTNAALCFTSRSCTAHSVLVVGYTL